VDQVLDDMFTLLAPASPFEVHPLPPQRLTETIT